ncbi:histidine phosphatase family protein [Microbacterium sp. SSW1-59]|uniref:histidine phosphatase family protein n=1 Tax=Microbacterium xanthum TaxID=3079794 RepID=UPI002AD4852B|nr:histidine phosphatase family protein [Microbacterium sp. SSW1-59]MDZ8202495.1 histidine phosphatase family protein [Microbacterium sp. SSW1-59]
MTSLFLVRHGETDWNRQRRIQGSTDIPLNDAGRAQAAEAAERLGELIAPGSTVAVAASDLGRARETAQIIADTLAAGPVGVYPALRERAYGEAEGLRPEEFSDRWGSWDRAEVPGAESWPDVRARALRGLRSAVADARRRTSPASGALVVVSHGALIRELLRHASAGELPREGERLPNGSIHRVHFERDHLRLLSYESAADALRMTATAQRVAAPASGS